MSPTSSITSSGNPAAATTATTNPLASESTFLTLLVSQLQNQDPLSPVDSTQFVSQLTSYSQLEQLINIDNNTTPPPAAGTTTGAAVSNSISNSASTLTSTTGI